VRIGFGLEESKCIIVYYKICLLKTNIVIIGQYFRFVQALRRNLKEKMESQRLDIPQLCACGPTVWDTNPDTCANNCVYYKNPKGNLF